MTSAFIYIASAVSFITTAIIIITTAERKRNRKESSEIQLNGQKGDRLTAVWQYGGFWAFLESSLFIQSFVYICDGSVLKVRHIAKLQNVGGKTNGTLG
ncbi:hypothetical protein ABF212_002428 [Flavobacterium psychrophilum]